MGERSFGGILKSSGGVGLATLCSRLLGLVRVMLEARVLGGGLYASAWQLAFMIPNLFRRILGEGALAQVLIPMIAHTEAQRGIRSAREELGIVYSTLGLILAVLTLAGIGGAILCEGWIPERYLYVRMALNILPVMMPYAFFICLVGVTGAVLNTRKVFFLPALGALLLNVFMIGALAAGFYWDLSGAGKMIRFLRFLAFAEIAAGALHLGLMLILLYRNGLFPALRHTVEMRSRTLREVFSLAWPGMLGASATQLSFLCDRALAAFLGKQAVPALTYSDRIVYLPIGVIALALGTVLMVSMSQAAARGDYEQMLDSMRFGLRHVLFMCIPVMIFVMVFRREILALLFLHGKFTASDLEETAWALLWYAPGIPLFCALKVVLPAFYARKRMRETFRVSLIAIGVNLVLNLILMWPLRQGGLALATVLSALANNVLLLWLLRREGFSLELFSVLRAGALMLLAALPGAGLWFAYGRLKDLLSMPYLKDAPAMLIVGVLFVGLYLTMLKCLRRPEFGELCEAFLRRRNRRRA